MQEVVDDWDRLVLLCLLQFQSDATVFAHVCVALFPKCISLIAHDQALAQTCLHAVIAFNVPCISLVMLTALPQVSDVYQPLRLLHGPHEGRGSFPQAGGGLGEGWR